jgi:hypothetical protein
MENPTGEEGQLMRAAALLPGTRKRNRETSGSDLAALAAFVWAVSRSNWKSDANCACNTESLINIAHIRKKLARR